MTSSSDPFAAALRRLASEVSSGHIEATLAEIPVHARAALGVRAAVLRPFEAAPALVFAAGASDPKHTAALVAQVESSGAPEADGDALAVPIEGLFGPWGVLVADGLPAGTDAPRALVQLLRMAAVAGRCVAHLQSAQVLAEQEARAQAILETTVDAIITIGADGRIHAFNRAAERIFRMTSAEAIGHNVSMLMPEPDRARHDTYIQRYIETGEARIIGIGREVTGRRASGDTFPMDLSVSEVQVSAGERIFTGIVRDLSDRRALEHEVLRVSDEERRRIGQDLHDGLGQMLSGIALITSGLARKLKPAAPEASDEVEEIAGLVREADTYARTLARSLVPVELAQGGLYGALERLADSARRLFALDIALDLPVALPELDPEVALHFYRIAQEAVSNAVRHGGARAVTVVLSDDADATRLTVADDGRGFGAEVADRADAGIGLRIMHHRARLIGAALDLESRAGEGTVISVVRRHTGQTPGRSLEQQLRALPRS